VINIFPEKDVTNHTSLIQLRVKFFKHNNSKSRAVLLTDIFSVAAVAATVGLRWPLCINHTKKAVKFKYTFKVYQYFSHLGISACYRHTSRL
jgi:hypothetical protein